MARTLALGEIVGATVIIYLFLVVLLRAVGRRTLAELSALDLVVTLCLGSAVETAMIRADTTLAAGIASAVALLVTNRLLTWVVAHSKRARRLVVGGPTILIHDGRVLSDRAARHGLSIDDLAEAVRERQIDGFDAVRFAVLEPDGEITVVPRDRPAATPGS